MDSFFDFLKTIQTSNIPAILVVAGILMVLLSLSGGFSTKLTIPASRQKWAASFGTALLVLGLILYVIPIERPENVNGAPPTTESTSEEGTFGTVFTTTDLETYSKGEGERWTSRKPNDLELYHFSEVHRTADYIELRNVSRNHNHVRLYRDHVEFYQARSDGDPAMIWRSLPGSLGRWD